MQGRRRTGEARHKVPKPHGKVLLLSEFFMCAGAQHNVIDNPVRQDAAPGSRGVAAAARVVLVQAPGREFYIIRLSISVLRR